MSTVAVFYSLEGTTKELVDHIQNKFEIDVLEINPVKEVNAKGFSKFVWGGMQAVMKKTPELLPYKIDLSKYDNVILGSPVWAGTYAPPLRTFMEQEDIRHKNVMFFCCHEGGMGKTKDFVMSALDSKNKMVHFKDFSNAKNDLDGSKAVLSEWVEGIIK